MASKIMNAVKGVFTREGGSYGKESFDEKVQRWTMARWTIIKNTYIVYHQAIWEALLFYAGQSWIAWDENRKIWQPVTPSDEWTPRPRINRFAPTVDSVSSNFNNVPEIEAVPKDRTGAKPEVHGVADLCTALVRHGFSDNAVGQDYKNEEEKAGFASQVFVLTGCFFTFVHPERKKIGSKPVQESVPTFNTICRNCDEYNVLPPEESPPPHCPTCGQPLEVEETAVMQGVMGEDGEPATEPIYETKIKIGIGNSLYAFPRPGSKNMPDSDYFMWAERYTLDQIRQEYEEDFPEGWEPQPDAEYPDGFSATYQHALNYYYTGYSSTTEYTRESALVIKLWAEPGKMKEFPNGVHGVIINGRAIVAREWDFVEHPIAKVDYLSLPTLFFPRCVAFDLVEIQRELNSYESIIKLHAMTGAADPWVVDQNTMVSEITGRGDKVIKWRSIGPGSKEPHRSGAGRLDSGIYTQRQQLHEEFDNISGAVATFRGKQEGGITAGRAIDSLNAQAEQMFSKPLKHWNDGWKEVGRKYVKNCQAFMSREEISSIVGPNKEVLIDAFMKADLDKLVDFIATSYGLPRTRQERRVEMMELFDRGALDLSDININQKIFELFGETGMGKQFNLDATRARMENKGFLNNIPPKFMPGIEDSMVHLSIHKEQAKVLDFDEWPKEAQLALIKHIEETNDHLAALAAAQAQAEEGDETKKKEKK